MGGGGGEEEEEEEWCTLFPVFPRSAQRLPWKLPPSGGAEAFRPSPEGSGGASARMDATESPKHTHTRAHTRRDELRALFASSTVFLHLLLSWFWYSSNFALMFCV